MSVKSGSGGSSIPNIYPAPAHESRSICLKAFVISVIFLGAIALVTGVLALLASQGTLASGLNSVSKLSHIGIVNSSLMIAGGAIVFMMGLAAWTCHLRKTQIQQH